MVLRLTFITLLVFTLRVSHANSISVLQVISQKGALVTLDLDLLKEAPPKVTLISGSKYKLAIFKKMLKKCEYLCGTDDEKTCHNEGVYELSEAPFLKFNVSSTVAIGGDHDALHEDRSYKFNLSSDAINLEKLLSSKFSGGYRWTKEDDKAYLYSGGMGPKGIGSKDWFAPPVSLDTCKISFQADFRIFQCRGISLLYYQDEIIQTSIAEYASGELKLLFSFNLGGKRYYAVQVSIKGHGQKIKLLTRDGSKWIELFTAPTYPGIC